MHVFTSGNQHFIWITDSVGTLSRIICTLFTSVYTSVSCPGVVVLSCGVMWSPGLKASLERLQLDYVDVVFANRPDPNTPMEGMFLYFSPSCFQTIPPFAVHCTCTSRHASVSMTTVKWRLLHKPQKSIFKRCILSWCFHLRSPHEDRWGCRRPLNGSVLTVCGLSWSHTIHLLVCQSSSTGWTWVRYGLAAFTSLPHGSRAIMLCLVSPQ